jgi:tellurite resistance protein
MVKQECSTPGLLAVLASLLAGCVIAPAQHQLPPPPGYGFDEIRQCRAQNQQAHSAALDAYLAASRAGRIDPGEAQQFNAMQERLRNLQMELARDGLSLQECQRIGGAIAMERAEVERMTRSDPALARCLADTRRAHQEVLALYEDTRRFGRIDPGEAKRFNAGEARLQHLRTELGRDGLSVQECQRIGATIARERDEVIRMAYPDPVIARCVADNRRAREDLYRVYDAAVRAGRIEAREAQTFQAIEKQMSDFQAEIRRDGLSLHECQRVGVGIARERALVDEMVR